MNLELSLSNKLQQHRFWIMICILGAIFSLQHLEAQVRIPFKQRTSNYTPDTKIYNIKGDFQLIGNTNMTLSSYSDNGSNNVKMKYVDIDNDANTLNSSSATLTFSTEGGADPNCSNIIYAGLYWTGRAHDEESPNSFTVGGSTNERTNGTSFNNYTLSISSNNNTSLGTDGTVATYTFTPQKGESSVTFRFSSWKSGATSSSYSATVTVQTGSGTVTTLAGKITNNSSNSLIFTFDTPYCINTGSQTIHINSLRKRRSDISVNSNYLASVTSDAKLLNKRQVKLKKAGGTYQTITADAQDIYYPTSSDDYMYSAYAEVTDYVKQHKTGEYFVADIALREGEGGSAGFYGGWGLIVVYENPLMKWRDITIFDGHAYVASNGGNKELPVSGFNTVQQGPVGVKMGLMAGEGDVSITGDQFKIRNAANTAWINLSHGGNSTNNFFNSSIYTGGNARNPELRNNTGLDISMFTLDNTNNSLIGNNQTSTNFQYNSTQDTYIIFCIAMAVDAYIPEIEAENHVWSINNTSYTDELSSGTVYPNDEIEYTVYLKNLGSEAVIDGKITIPIPFTASLVEASDKYFWKGNPQMAGSVNYSPLIGGAGTITWDIGYIPLPENKDEILAQLTYRIKVTDDCFILSNSACVTISVDGTTTGTGMTSGVSFTNNKFVTGYVADGTCSGLPMHNPTIFNIDASDFLLTSCIVPEGEDADYYTSRKFKYCGLSADAIIPYSDVSPNFPKGSKFYSAIAQDENGFIIPAEDAVCYTSASGFPIGTFDKPTTYYAIPPGFTITCYWEFTITVEQYCGNFWIGSESCDWATPENWTAKKVPDSGDDIEFATVINNKNNPAQRDLYLDKNRIIGNLINNSDLNLVVTAGNQLTIGGKIVDENPLQGTIVIKSDTNIPTGTLFFTNPSACTSVKATVEFINKAYECDSCGFYSKQWQYFGIPVKSSAFPYRTPMLETINQWVEPYLYGNKWRPTLSGTEATLNAFQGYEITSTANTDPTHIYRFSGTLNVGDAIIPLTKTLNVDYSGINLIGNSFTAAIPINSLAINLGSVALKENTAYLFNMGTRDQWRKLNGGISNGIAAGQYQAIPFNLAGQAGLPDRILSMHAFMLNVATPGNIVLAYDQLVKNASNTTVPDSRKYVMTRSNPDELPHIIIDVIGRGSADRVWLFEHKDASTGFDNGWDGYKMKEGDLVQAYICGDDQTDYQVATVPDIEGTTLGIKCVSAESYTINLSATSHVELRKLYLKDLYTGRTYPIINNAEYIISGSQRPTINRFKIITASSGSTDIEERAVNTYVRNNVIVVENLTDTDYNACIYDIRGKMIANKQAKNNDICEFMNLPIAQSGIYIVKVTDKNRSIKTDKVVLK